MTLSFTLDQIAPKAGPKFSPNLHAWMRKNHRHDPNEALVFRHADDALYVGYFYDDDFIGSSLGQILTQGVRAETYCYPGRLFRPDKLIEVTDFWAGYIRLGRCFIDPEHRRDFIGERWEERGAKRTCLWCGAKQKLVSTKKTVVARSWVPADSARATEGAP